MWLVEELPPVKETKPSNWRLDRIDIYDVLNKIIKNSSVFEWLTPTLLLHWLKNRSIKVKEIPSWEIIIKENDSDCDSFYVLLNGELWIYKGSTQIAIINKLSVFGEIGFLDQHQKRTATVKANSAVAVLIITNAFLCSIDARTQWTIFRNLARELSQKVLTMNTQILKDSSTTHHTISELTSKMTDQILGNFIDSWVPIR